MSRVSVYFAEGFEEIEALCVVDILRRANIKTDMVSVTGNIEVTGARGIKVVTDRLFSDDIDCEECIVLPGGIPGTPNLRAHGGLMDKVKAFNEKGKYIAAICAAPTILGSLGILEGKEATCYPGMEDELFGALVKTDRSVVMDGNIITSRGMGTAIDFSLHIVSILADKETSCDLGRKIVYAPYC